MCYNLQQNIKSYVLKLATKHYNSSSWRSYDAPPHSLKDSNANSKVKTTKGVRVCSLAHSTSGVRGAC
jgi:hypothetical protein